MDDQRKELQTERQLWRCRVEGQPGASRLKVGSLEKADALVVRWQGWRSQDKGMVGPQK